jgi:hypothetical protein
MNRLLLAALAALLVLPAASAQVAFGARAGLNVSTFTGDSASDFDPKLGFAGGLTATAPLGTSGLFVQPEIGYSQKGARIEGNTVTSTWAVDYVEPALLVGFAGPVTQTGLSLGVYAGPTLGIKTREARSGTSGPITVIRDTDAFRSTDVGVAAGLTLGAGPFAVDGRYTVGLNDALSDDVVNAELRNSAFTISAVYRFGM